MIKFKSLINLVQNRSNIQTFKSIQSRAQFSACLIRNRRINENFLSKWKSNTTKRTNYLNDFKKLTNQSQESFHKPSQTSTPPSPQSISIFKRFKEAYKQHGKVLIYCHIVTCFGWIIGFYVLSKGGYDIDNVLVLLEKLKIMSNESKNSIISKIENFQIDRFLLSYHFDYVLSTNVIDWLKERLTGQTLKHIITAIMLYKIFTPFRYLVTLSLTKVLIEFSKKYGFIPKTPPAGYSIKDIYSEQKILYQKRLQNQRERLKTKNIQLRSKFERGKFWKPPKV